MAKLNPNDLKSEPADLYARLPHEQTPAAKFIAQVKGMLVGDEYAYAEDTLRGMLATAERRGIVTDRMRDAVAKIADNPRGNRARRGW